MWKYIQEILTGVWTKAFWVERLATLRAYVESPARFFRQADKKEWQREAILFGMIGGLVPACVILAAAFGSFYFLLGEKVLWFVLFGIVLAAILWIVMQLGLFYLGPLVFGWILKIISKKEISREKLRAILYAVEPVLGLNLIPGIGGVLAVLGCIILLVIAYENAFQVSRGQAIGSAIGGWFSSSAVIFLISAVVAAGGALFVGSVAGLGKGIFKSREAQEVVHGIPKTMEQFHEVYEKWGSPKNEEELYENYVTQIAEVMAGLRAPEDFLGPNEAASVKKTEAPAEKFQAPAPAGDREAPVQKKQVSRAETARPKAPAPPKPTATATPVVLQEESAPSVEQAIAEEVQEEVKKEVKKAVKNEAKKALKGVFGF